MKRSIEKRVEDLEKRLAVLGGPAEEKITFHAFYGGTPEAEKAEREALQRGEKVLRAIWNRDEKPEAEERT